MTEQTGWLFTLENGDEVELDSDLTAKQVVEQLQELDGRQYIWDDDNVVSVRRVVCAKRMVESAEERLARMQYEQMRPMRGGK